MTAYTSGGASIVVAVFNQWSAQSLSMEQGTLLLVGALASVLYIGTTWVDWFNRVLMLGLVITYGTLVVGAVPRVESAYIEVVGHMKYLWAAIPLLITAFGFHLSLPSLKTYLNHNLTWLRLAVLFGSFLSLLVYILWEYVILGIIPHEQLISMARSGNSVTELTNIVQFVLQATWITNSIQLFMLFALMTSFIGVSLGIFDFFADGLKIAKNPLGKLLLLFLTLGIPTLFSFWDPAIFLKALSYGGFFGAILLIGFPAVMALRSRMQFKTGYRVFGGMVPLLLVIAFGVLVMVLRILEPLGFLPMP
jgi:tyrosine-specific transport protein